MAASQSVSKGGFVGTLTTKVTYVNDPTPLSYTTYANYKKVVVTVTRTSDSRQLAQEVTLVAPPLKASATNAVIQATVMDYGNSTPVANVPVALATGPSAPRSDTTDTSGSVTFAALTPNPTSGGQAYYDLSLTPPTGYVTLYDTVSPAAPAHVQLSPGQTWSTVLSIYKPATITVQLKNNDGSTFAGAANATVSYTRNSTPYSKTLAYAGSPLTITTFTEGSQTVQAIPGISYSASAVGNPANGGYPNGFYQAVWNAGASRWDPQTSLTENVPDAYPTTLTHTFTLTNAPLAKLNVTVKNSAGTACSNGSVTVSAGPWGGAPWNFSLTRTMTGTSAAQFDSGGSAVPLGTGYSIKGVSGTHIATLTNQTVVAGTNTFNVNVGASC